MVDFLVVKDKWNAQAMLGLEHDLDCYDAPAPLFYKKVVHWLDSVTGI
jgi:hypothetical protein